eukprot:GFUD01042765.1.p1 GENE.GFUD01042765.1~~GFUD01042765.1.p1  ORF type:complete len:110 (-),score=14.69 GFUD01042765.1:416-745(-)
MCLRPLPPDWRCSRPAPWRGMMSSMNGYDDVNIEQDVYKNFSTIVTYNSPRAATRVTSNSNPPQVGIKIQSKDDELISHFLCTHPDPALLPNLRGQALSEEEGRGNHHV